MEMDMSKGVAEMEFDTDVITEDNEPVKETGVAKKETTAVVVPPEREDSGSLDAGDFILPYLKITQKQTEYEDLDAKEYSFGDLVLKSEGMTVVLPQPVKFYVLDTNKYFEEYVPHEEDRVPLRSANERELVRMLGPEGMAKTDKWGPYYPCAHMTLLVERPEGCTSDAEFPFEAAGKQYGYCTMIASRSGYVAYKVINTTKTLTWRGDLQKGAFTMETRRKPGPNPYYVPVVRIAQGDVPEEVRALFVVPGKE